MRIEPGVGLLVISDSVVPESSLSVTSPNCVLSSCWQISNLKGLDVAKQASR